ncbi:MAG: hypothetical protein ABEK01_04820 [Candidatus Nanohaloarchaea archaeon]
MGREDDNSRIFYGLSAVFVALAIGYFGFVYLGSLSPFTISVLMFAVTAALFLAGGTRQGDARMLLFLSSAGSYMGLLGYLYTHFINSTDGVMVSLVFSAGLFALAGYTVTRKEDMLPGTEAVKKAVSIMIILLLGLTFYDIYFTSTAFSVELEDRVSLEPGQNVIGEVKVQKEGYIPVEMDGVQVSYCVHDGRGIVAVSGREFGGGITGFGPTSERYVIKADIPPGALEDSNISSGESIEIMRVQKCLRNVNEKRIDVTVN